MSTEVLVTFVVYFIALIAIGLYFFRKSSSIDDYLLGGRAMGSWVTALSAQASDMSGWLLMGLPGAIYLGGLGNSWIAMGLFAGTILNWTLVSAPLRIYTEKVEAITLPCFFEERFKDPTGLLRTVSAIIILFFFTIYASSGLVAAGKLFNSIFDVNYHTAVIIGGVVIILYTFLGGFLAVCWTDLFQGLLMVIAIIIVPILGLKSIGGLQAVANQMYLRSMPFSIFDTGTRIPSLAIISTLAWGLGYFGQPHILTRFMSAKSIPKLRQASAIAIVWVFISLVGAIFVGTVSIGMFPDLDKPQAEKVFIFMIESLFNPWVGGIMLAAIMSAIMSTIDSQLLVSSSALTEDFYQKVIKKDASEKEVVFVGRLCVMIISAIALVMAMDEDSSILGIVAYAWGGLGAAFGPVVLFALFSKKTTWFAALAGMVVGTVVLVLWERLGYGDVIYEIIPGFAANCMLIWVINTFSPQQNSQVIKTFEEVKTQLK
ncbi:MAG: sodium/proline symporter PutP [Planctomycetes bacterium]|nr:sodium/proline symporter PutP [Planctomycetota bacterium]